MITELREGFAKQWKAVQPRAKMFYYKRRRLFPNLNLVVLFIRMFLKQRDATWIATGSRSLMMVGLAMIFSLRKSIAILHGHELLKGQWFKSWLVRCNIRSFSMAVAVSAFSKNNSNPHLDQNKIVVIPNGFNPDKYSITLPHKRNLFSPQINLITVGRISTRKGQHNVVKALPTLIKNHPDLIYHMVGINDRKQGIDSLIETLSLKDHVRFHGVLSDGELEVLFKSSDIFIMLSENQSDGDVEGFGIAIIEANYFGMPAIGSFGCGIEQAIKDGFNGRLVWPNEPEKIGAALEEVLSNYPTYSTNALRWAKDHGWPHVIKKYLDVISIVNQQTGISGFFGAPDNYLHKDFGVRVRQKFVRDLIGDISGKTILDIGCGDGRVSLPFAGRNKLTLMDSSPNMINLAMANTPRNYVGNVLYITNSLEESAIKEDQYDLIIAVGLLAHLSSWTDSLSLMSKWLKKGGKIVIQISDASHWLIRKALKPRGKRLYSLNSITRDQLIEECRKNGLTRVEKRRYGFSVRGIGLFPNWFLYHFTMATARNRFFKKFSTEVIMVFEKE